MLHADAIFWDGFLKLFGNSWNAVKLTPIQWAAVGAYSQLAFEHCITEVNGHFKS